MTAVAKAIARALGADDSDAETLKVIIIFCAVGLFVALLFAAYGLDLGSAFN